MTTERSEVGRERYEKASKKRRASLLSEERDRKSP